MIEITLENDQRISLFGIMSLNNLNNTRRKKTAKKCVSVDCGNENHNICIHDEVDTSAALGKQRTSSSSCLLNWDDVKLGFKKFKIKRWNSIGSWVVFFFTTIFTYCYNNINLFQFVSSRHLKPVAAQLI